MTVYLVLRRSSDCAAHMIQLYAVCADEPTARAVQLDIWKAQGERAIIERHTPLRHDP